MVFGGFDVLINNVVIMNLGGKLLMEFDVLMWDVVMNVNVCGVWFVSNVVLLYFVWLGCGVIVNFVLDIVLWGVLKLFVYVVSKGVVIVMMYV